MTSGVKFCDRCRKVDMTVMRSRLKVIGLIPRGKCGCHFLCEPCRDELVEALQV